MNRAFGQTVGLAALVLGIFCHLPHPARGSDADHPSTETQNPQHVFQRHLPQDPLFSLSQASPEMSDRDVSDKSPSVNATTSLVKKTASRNFRVDPKDLYETILTYLDTTSLLEARTLSQKHTKAISL